MFSLHFDLEVSDDNYLSSGIKESKSGTNGSWDEEMISNTSDFFIKVSKNEEINIEVSYENNKVIVNKLRSNIFYFYFYYSFNMNSGISNDLFDKIHDLISCQYQLLSDISVNLGLSENKKQN